MARSGTPRPGRPVRGSATGRPIMALLDLLGRRWALRVLWELRAGPVPGFRELQSRCGGVSSSVLTGSGPLRDVPDATLRRLEELTFAFISESLAASPQALRVVRVGLGSNKYFAVAQALVALGAHSG